MLPLFYLCTIGLFTWLLATRSYLMLRPSMWFALIMLTRINSMAAFAGPQLDEGYLLGHQLRLLTLLFPMGIFLWILATPGYSSIARVLANRCRDTAGQTDNTPSFNSFGLQTQEFKTAMIFFGGSVLAMIIYLRTVPLMSTGLVTMFTNPIYSSLAREESLKLVSSPLVRYTFMWHTIVLAPVLVGLAVQAKLPLFSLRNALRICLVVLTLASVMLTGARATGGRLIIVMGLVYFLRMGARRGSWTLVPGAGLVMVLAAVISNLREGKMATMGFSSLADTVANGIFRRVFETAYMTGVWTNHLAQDWGNFGVASIRPLASLFNIQYINVANLSGLTFAHNPLVSINATTCFLFAYQAAFGLIPGWGLSLVLICALDLLLPMFLNLKGRLLVTFLAAFLMVNMVLVGSNFTTALLSHGILPVAFLAWITGKITTGKAHA